MSAVLPNKEKSKRNNLYHIHFKLKKFLPTFFKVSISSYHFKILTSENVLFKISFLISLSPSSLLINFQYDWMFGFENLILQYINACI